LWNTEAKEKQITPKEKKTTARHTSTYTGIHTFKYIGEKRKQSEKNDIYIYI